MAKKEILENLGEGVQETFDPNLKRAFDFADDSIPDVKKDTELLALKDGEFVVSGDGVFYTIQGEGPTMGKPTVFLRLHVCNLQCVWCDSWYTWNPKTPEFWTEPNRWTIEDTAKNVEDVWGCENPDISKRLVITGGEPMLQKDNITKMIPLLDGWDLEIETNGTIMPTSEMLERFQFNCSPKLGNSENAKQARFKPEVLKELAKWNTKFKFVVMNDSDLDEIEEDFVKELGLDPEQVILMPQGMTGDEVLMNAKRVAEYAKKKGYRLLSRLHTELWGSIRKV